MVSPRIQVTSPVGPLELKRLRAEEVLGRPYVYDLEVLGSVDIKLADLLGQPMSVHVELAEGVTRHFGGIVYRAALSDVHGRNATYEIQLRAQLSLLEHRATSRIFQGESVRDVIKKVLQEHGVMVEDDYLTRDPPKLDYLVQYRESDLHFVMRLMEEEGIYFFIRQAESTQTMILCDSISAHHLEEDKIPGYETVRYVPAGTSAEVGEDAFERWVYSQELRTHSYSIDEFHFKTPKANLHVRSLPIHSKGIPTHELDDYGIYEYTAPYTKEDQGKHYAKARLEEMRVDQCTAVGSGTVRGLSAGHVFKLVEHPHVPQNAEYLVTGMALTLEAGALESGGAGEVVVHCSVAVQDASIPFRLKRITPKPVIHGPQSAIVVGKKGEEIWTDEYGRVKVQFPWDRTKVGAQPEIGSLQQTGDETTSCWIRVAQIWAGSKFGGIHIPRIGQEVLVEFMEGDPDRPIVTGRVYNEDNKPPYDLPANATQSGIKSRSSKGDNKTSPDNANEIRMEDKKGKEELYVQAERNHTVKVKKDRSLSVGGNETVSVSGTRSSTITKKSTDTYKDELEVTVTKKTTETFNDEHTWKIVKQQTIDVTADKTEHITGIYKLTTDKQFLLTQGGTTVDLVSNALTMTVGAALLMKAGGAKVNVDEGGVMTLETPSSIHLKCGASTIDITPSGITITSPQISAKAAPSELNLGPAAAVLKGAATNVEATAICSISGMTVKLN